MTSVLQISSPKYVKIHEALKMLNMKYGPVPNFPLKGNRIVTILDTPKSRKKN